MSKFAARALAVALAMAPAAVARAHGGEDHGAEERAAVTEDAHERSVSLESDRYSVALRYPVEGTAGRLLVRVYVARFETSEPVRGAGVRLELRGLADVRATEREPGIYEATIADPGAHRHADAVLTVEGTPVDLLTFTGLGFGPLNDHEQDHDHDHGAEAHQGARALRPAYVLGAGAVTFAVVVAASVVLARRRPGGGAP